MEPIEKSGFYYPNRFALITLEALEAVMGKNGLNAILNLAHLSHLIDNYPPANLERKFDFGDYASLCGALEEMYGPRGGHSLGQRAGHATFNDALGNFGAMAGVSDLAFKLLPLKAKLSLGLPSMAKIFSQVSDQVNRVEETDTEFHYIIDRCPVCWGRDSEAAPICFLAVGLLEEGLKWVSGGREFHVAETECLASGGEVCRFVINKQPTN